MKLQNLKSFANSFEEKFGAKLKRVGVNQESFKEFEKELEDTAPVQYTACYNNGLGTINVLGVEVFESR